MPRLRNIVYLTEAQKQTLFSTGTITVGGQTITYSDNDIYIVPQLWNIDGSASDNLLIKDNTNTTRLTLSNSGTLTAAGFSGSGSLLTIPSAVVSPANNDYLLIADTSESNKISRAISIGTGTTTFLRNDGTWASPDFTNTFVNVTGDTMTGDLTLNYSFPRINFTDTDNDSDYSLINDNGTFSLYDTTNSAHRIRVLSNGNVGIGVSSPSVKLDVAGQVNISSAAFPPLNVERTSTQTNTNRFVSRFLHTTSGDMTDGFGSQLTFDIRDNANVINTIGSVGATRSGADGSGRLIFNTFTTGTENERMTILPDGNVGIGTNVPAHRFTVSGALSTSTSQIGIRNFEGGMAIVRAGITGVQNGGFSFITANEDNTNQNVRMVINTSGNVGIGTTAPSTVLELQRSGDVDFGFKNTADTSGNFWKLWQDNYDSVPNTNFLFKLSYGSTDVITANPNGRVGIGTTSPAGLLHLLSTADVRQDIQTSSTNNTAILEVKNNADNVFIQNLAYGAGVSGDLSGIARASTARMTGQGANVIYGNRANNPVSFISNDLERMRITSAGNVGIGTNAPARLLSLVTSSNADGIQIRRNSDTTNEFASLSFRVNLLDNNVDYAQIRAVRTNRVASADTDLTFATISNGTLAERMRIRDDGNVGIGTTSPLARLDVVFADGTVGKFTRTSGGTSINTSTPIRAKHKTSSDMTDGFGASVAFLIEDNANVENEIAYIGAVRSGADNSGRLVFQTITTGTATEKMTILPNGNVGIGTTSPTYPLDIVASNTGAVLRLRNTSTGVASFTGSHLFDTAGSLIAHFGYANTSVTGTLSDLVYFGSIASKSLVITTADVERLRVLNTGLVGINETSPSAQLQVKSGATNRVPLIVDSLTSHATNLQEWKVNGTNQAIIYLNGNIGTNGAIRNINDINRSSVDLNNNGTIISRNISDSNPALKVNQVHASSTGNLLDLQAAGTNVISFRKDGTLLAPATFTIDPSTHDNIAGKVIILGDLQVDGTTTTINSTTIDVADKNILLSKGATNKAASDGAGITIDLGTDGTASLLYGSTNDIFSFNKGLSVGGQLSVSSSTFPPLSAERTTTATNSYAGSMRSLNTTTADMVDGFGALLNFSIRDNAGVINPIVNIGGQRSGADNSGRLVISTFNAGTETEKMTILPNGNVGIGTTAPERKLDVFGNARFNNLLGVGGEINIGTPNDAIGFNFIKPDTSRADIRYESGRLSFALRGVGTGAPTERMVITEGGNVGIGTSAPVGLLNVNAAGRAAVIGGVPAGAPNSTVTSGVTSYLEIVAGTAGGATNGSALVFHNPSISTASLEYKNADANLGYFNFRSDDTDWRVGIGTVTPSERLHVVGKTYLSGGSAAWNETTPGTTRGTLHLGEASSTSHFGSAITFGARDAGSGTTAQGGIYTRTDGTYGTKMYIATTSSYAAGSQTRLMIDHVGNVGIGTVSPGDRLEVSGTIKANSLKINDTHFQDTATVTTTSTSSTVLATYAVATYATGKFLIQATSGVNRHVSELLVTHNGTLSTATEYAILKTAGNLFTVTTDISGGNVRILVTSASATSTAYKTTFTLIGV